MMSRALAALAFLSCSLTAAAYADRLAFVDMRRAIQECAEGKVAQKTLGSELAKKQKELDGERAKLKELSDALTKEESSLKPDEQDKRRRALREKYYEIERLANAIKMELRKKEATAIRPLRDKLLVVISTIAQREKLTHILHTESLLWTETAAMDLTNEIIRMADAAYAKARATPATGKTDEKTPAKPDEAADKPPAKSGAEAEEKSEK